MEFAQWATRKRLVVLAAIVVAVCAVVIAVILLTAKGDDKPSPAEDAIAAADAATTAGDYDKALDALKQAEAQAATNEEKIAVLSGLAAAAANAGQLEAALNYYAEKHKLDSGSVPADSFLVGELYERLGNTEQAVASYQRYVEYLQTRPADAEGGRDAEIAGMEERIRELEGGNR